MTTATAVAVDRMIGPTNSPVDLKLVAWALRIARSEDRYDAVLAEVKHRRAEWRAGQFRLQRRWQRETRRPSKARHHDSISIRDRYVRCAP